jgi:hypothetical protein
MKVDFLTFFLDKKCEKFVTGLMVVCGFLHKALKGFKKFPFLLSIGRYCQEVI